MDSVFIANACLNSRLKSGVPWLLSMSDLKKSYDHVHWNFRIHLQKKLGVRLLLGPLLDPTKVGGLCTRYNLFIYCEDLGLVLGGGGGFMHGSP